MVQVPAGGLVAVLFDGRQTVVFPEGAKGWVFPPPYAEQIAEVLEEWGLLASLEAVPGPKPSS